MKRIAYIIPGYDESHTKQKGYAAVAKLFEKKGIEPIHIDINWKSKHPAQFSDFVSQFLRQYKKPKNAEVYVLGFSYGATTAFLSAAKTKPTAFIFCSLSPYFTEDLPKLKPAWVKWFRKNFEKSDYSFKEKVVGITAPAHFIYGEKESEACAKRARSARRALPNSTLTIAKGAKHNISQKEYLVALERVLNKL